MKKLILILSVLVLLGVSASPARTFAATCDSSNPNAVYHADSFLWTCPDGSTSSSLPGVAPTPATQTTAPATPAAANTGCPGGGTQQNVIVNGQSVPSGCSLGYTPLEPIPGVTTGTNGTQLDFPTLLGNIYKIAITIGALFSVLMLTVSGVRYMLSDIVTDKARAKKRITACLYGLVLIAASWLILNTINPQLVRFNLNPGTATINAPPAAAPPGAVQTTQTAQQQALTQTIDAVAATPAGTKVFTPDQCTSAAADSSAARQQYTDCCQSQPLKCNAAGRQACGYTDNQARLQTDAVITDNCTPQ